MFNIKSKLNKLLNKYLTQFIKELIKRYNIDKALINNFIFNNQTITLTFGEQSENHVGMQKIGNGLAEKGFTIDDLIMMKTIFEQKDYKCELIKLDCNIMQCEPASLLIIRNGAQLLSETDPINAWNEQIQLDWDKKAWMKGRVCNKKARYNLCYANYSQEPDYENKKGRIINFDQIPFTKKIRDNLDLLFSEKTKNLQCEGNYYYDLDKCYISAHGDSERKKVIAVRLGSTMPLYYQWYQNSKPIGERIEIILNHGDVYVMSEKATGFDWKKRIIPTLRHAAGTKKALKLT